MGFLREFRQISEHLSKHHDHHDASTAILRVQNLSVKYESGYALDDVSFELNAAQRLAVVGPNGAGKSTLFKIIAGVAQGYHGQVTISGHEPSGHICIAYVPQRSQVDWSFPVTVEDVVMMGRIGKMGLFRNPTRRDWQLVHSALETVGITPLAKRQISQLSGGQQQRMFIARALAQEAELMLMDEPLTGLDANSVEDIFSIFEELKRRNVTVLVSLHNLRMAARRFDQVLLLNHRLLGIGSPAEVLTQQNLFEAYGGQLQLVPTQEGTMALEDTCCEHDQDHEHEYGHEHGHDPDSRNPRGGEVEP